jgi:hypothetical protein
VSELFVFRSANSSFSVNCLSFAYLKERPTKSFRQRTYIVENTKNHQIMAEDRRVREKVIQVKKDFLDSLGTDLSCSWCHLTPRVATVSLCIKSYHLTCPNCFQLKSRICGITNCNSQLLQIACSPLVEKLLKWLPVKCKLTQNGCTTIMMLKELEVHEIDCVFRNIFCPFIGCKDTSYVTFIGLNDHLTSHHGNLKKIGKPISMDNFPLQHPKPLGNVVRTSIAVNYTEQEKPKPRGVLQQNLWGVLQQDRGLVARNHTQAR